MNLISLFSLSHSKKIMFVASKLVPVWIGWKLRATLNNPFSSGAPVNEIMTKFDIKNWQREIFQKHILFSLVLSLNSEGHEAA